MNIAERILFDSQSWISARKLAALLGVREVQLRGDDSPIRQCSISGNLGYKHLKHATEEEINHFCLRLTAHAMSEMDRVKIIKDQKKHFNQMTLQL